MVWVLFLNGKLGILMLLEFSSIPKCMRKISIHSAGTLMTPYQLAHFPKDGAIIPLLRLMVTKTVVMTKAWGFVSQKYLMEGKGGRQEAEEIRKAFMEVTMITH